MNPAAMIDKKKLCNSIILVGPSGSGKSTLARLLSRSFGTEILEIGAIVIRHAREQPETTRPVDFADRFFSAGQNLTFVEELVGEAPPSRSPYIIVGPRLVDELRFLSHQYNLSISFGLQVSFDIRKRRWKNREPLNGRSESLQDWIERDKIEHRWGIDETVCACTHTILNERSKHEAVEFIQKKVRDL